MIKLREIIKLIKLNHKPYIVYTAPWEKREKTNHLTSCCSGPYDSLATCCFMIAYRNKVCGVMRSLFLIGPVCLIGMWFNEDKRENIIKALI